ncbi:MAG: TrkH family potassium uptake protein [Thaumarchaeota archaeon]|nr:TrkH family potassium uptake protein [Nitrososphaerota archaeon]
MFVGGCTFSTAGGLKVIRMMIAFRSVPWLVRNNMMPNSAMTLVKIGKNVFFEKEIAIVMAMLFTGAASVIATSAVIMLGGHSFLNSLFESVSAFTGTGLSTGVTSMELPDFAKVALIITMVVGKLEIIPVLITLKAVVGYLAQRERIEAIMYSIKKSPE